MWLEVRSGDDAGRIVEVPDVKDRPFVLGRVRGADYVVRDERASRRHVQLVPLGGGRMHLKDLGSANGTFLGRERVRESVLYGGEEIRVGDVRIGVLRAPPERPELGALITREGFEVRVHAGVHHGTTLGARSMTAAGTQRDIVAIVASAARSDGARVLRIGAEAKHPGDVRARRRPAEARDRGRTDNR